MKAKSGVEDKQEELGRGEVYITDVIRKIQCVSDGREVLITELEIICPVCKTPMTYKAGKKE